MMRVLSLFAGIGGFDLGLERAGYRTVRFVEKDPFCQRVLAKHWPGVPCDDDVTTAEFEEGEADVVVGGFPCQDLSYAGDGAGLAGERSGLWRELLRAIRVVRPLNAIVENVAALLGRGLGVVLGDLAEIGYDTEWHCIPASAVGAPHRRDRIWIVAHPGSVEHKGGRAPISGALAAQLLTADTDRDREHDVAVNAEMAVAPESVSDADGARSQGRVGAVVCERPGEWTARTSSPSVADPAGGGRTEGHSHAGGRSEGTRASQEWSRPSDGSWWLSEPDVGRVAHGVPARVDRLRSLGNAVVPAIPELIGRALLTPEVTPHV